MVLSPRCRFCLFIRNYYLAQPFFLKAFPLDLAPPIKKKKHWMRLCLAFAGIVRLIMLEHAA